MKLFLYDKFWDYFIKLPKNIQKKTTEFMSKFRHNSKSSAIHLEPIKTFKDKHLRTARIDKNYRAIIHVSDEGENYHILMIDNHDEAMRWAANKVFEWNRQTQVYQIYEMQEKVVEQKMLQTTKQETVISRISDNKLLDIGVPHKLLKQIKHINDYEALQKIERFIPDDLFERLFLLLDGVEIEFILAEIEEGLLKVESQEEQQKSGNNQRFFFEVKDDNILEEMLSGDFSKWKVFLHPSQRKLVERNYSFPVKITGGAGTGKTVVALHRAKYLSDSLDLFDSKPVFFTTYTKSLVKNLEKDFNQLKIERTKVFLNNFHNFVILKAKELKLIDEETKLLDFNKKYYGKLWDDYLDTQNTGFSTDFLQSEYAEVVLSKHIKDSAAYLKTARVGRSVRLNRRDRVEVWKLIAGFKEVRASHSALLIAEVVNMLNDYYSLSSVEKPFSCVIADEIQDFEINELNLLRNVVADKDNDLFLVGDPLQKIYARNTNFSKAGINVKGRRSIRLKLNYRTTEEIKKLAVSAIKNVDFDNFEGEDESKKGYISLLSGEKPSYQCFKTVLDEVAYIINIIENNVSENKFQYADICIAGRKKDDLKEIKKQLHRDDIPFFDLISDSGSQDGVRLSTFHSLKGLEFKIVILVGVDERNCPFKPYGFESYSKIEQFEHIKREKALMYVAITRAVQLVYLTGLDNKSDLIQV